MTKSTDASRVAELDFMDEKRKLLLDHLTRQLCGDQDVDMKLLDEATGGWFSDVANEGSEGVACDDSVEQIIGVVVKKMILACRWMGLPPEKKPRKRRTATAKGNSKGTPAKKRGRPRGSKNKSKTASPEKPDNSTPEEAPDAPPPPETRVTDRPDLPATPTA